MNKGIDELCRMCKSTPKTIVLKTNKNSAFSRWMKRITNLQKKTGKSTIRIG